MPGRVRIVAEDGRPYASKTSDAADEADRLACESEWLRRCAHPGVVELHRFERTATGADLRTVYAGRALATATSLSVDEIAGVIAAVADTVADLHDLGIVHGRLGPSHVLIGPTGRPRVCGFSGAAAAADGALPADDVRALGVLLADLIGSDAAVEVVPERRLRFTRRTRTADTHRRALLTLADHATREEPQRRPTARALAAAIQAAVPSAILCIPREDDAVGESLLPSVAIETAGAPTTSARPTLRSGLVAGGIVVLVALGVTQLAADDAVTTAQTDAAPVRRTASTTRAASAASTSAPTSTTARCANAAPAAARDATGDSCPDIVAIDGAVIRVGTRRFSLGESGDVIVVGDWDCDSTVTPALLRRRSGDVFIFDDWATIGHDVTTTAVTRVSGGTNLRVTTRGSCDGLVALAPGREAIVLRPGGAR